MNSSHTPVSLDMQAKVARALAHPHRLALLRQIALGECAVEQLAEYTGLSIANASQHLQQLRRAGCVATHRDGKRVCYRLRSTQIAKVLVTLAGYVEYQQSEIQGGLEHSRHNPDDMEQVSIRELIDRMNAGSVVLLDLRSDEEFARGHLPGAVHIPIEELADRIGELSEHTDVIAYCQGQYCVLTMKAVEILRSKGKRATALAGGVHEWQAAGLKTET